MGPVLPAAAGAARLWGAQAPPAGRAQRRAFARELEAALQGPPDGHPPAAGAGAPAGPSLAVDLPGGPLPQGASGLEWAAQGLESLLWAHWLQEALSPAAGGGLGGGFAASVYGDWLARAFAELLVQDGPHSLSRMLVAQLSASQNRENEIP